MARYDPAGTGHHPTASGPTDTVSIRWTHDAPEWFLGTTSLVRRGDTLYAVGNGLLALDSESGDRQFGRAGPYQSSPALAPAPAYNTDTLAVTAPSGVFGLNAGGGFTIPLLNRPVGVERWAGPQSAGGGFFGPAEADTPVTADGVIYAALPGTNSVAALDPNNGRVLWRRTHHEDDPVSAEINRPAVSDGLVFVTNWPKQAAAYHAETGARQWLVELDDQLLLPPVATEHGVVVPSREFVYLLDPTDGSEVWRYSTDGNATESTPAVSDGTIFVADERESLHAIALATGQQRWTAPFDGPTTPVVADGTVYAVRSGYSLVALDAESGETLFEYRPSQVPLSTPIVGDGVLYAANRKRILALEEAA
ncbi:Outer membrane protein assembly factor BamB, contains PQQ-like beta-propeller repeat [Halopelagius longus]|nr:Outer membrane protein assembly factor BamB, contains PQQ-like beta-propeller repeat [Halopelagius longus]